MSFIRLILLNQIITCFAISVNAQLSVVPIIKQEDKKAIQNKRIENLEPMQLPFWDDFSFSKQKPVDTLWSSGAHVEISSGIGLNPPSINVATFNGLDGNGRPYNITDPLAVGLTDSLISRRIKMTDVLPSLRNTVYLSFYFQYQGLGEAPDLSDEFRLELRNNQMQWETVWTVTGEENFNPQIFYPVIIPVHDDRFFHDEFQFKFQAVGRQSGPFDTWNLDYIFLAQFRNDGDLSFPDRTIVSPLSSLFNRYWSVPLKHFFNTEASLLNAPFFTLFNLKDGFSQPINFNTEVTITNIFEDDIEESAQYLLDDAAAIGGSLQSRERRTVSTENLPDINWFHPQAKEIKIDYELSVSTKDNVFPDELGDYESRYVPVDFRWNDTTRISYMLSDYYAYDDGSAEYAAGLNAAGGRVAYRFDIVDDEPDTLVSVDIYFPFVGNTTATQIDLIVLNDLEDSPSSLLHLQRINIERTGNNAFTTYVFREAVGVRSTFYIGWRQSTDDRVDVGLDKNSQSGNRIFFNLGNTWQQNTSVSGSLMIRPRIGKGTGPITSVEKPSSNKIEIWPNPSTGIFNIRGNYDAIQLMDAMGRPIHFLTNKHIDYSTIDISHQPAGLYLIKIVNGKSVETRKIIRQ